MAQEAPQSNDTPYQPLDGNKQNENQQEQEQQNVAPPQQEDNSAEAIKFIKEKIQSAFDEASAKKLFSFYQLDQNTDRLQPPDVRKLLLDILQAMEWPLVCPDEALNNVLHELCLNDEGSISWVEFKSFFVFLQDKPLLKLFQLTSKLFDQKQILYSRLVKIIPAKIKPELVEEDDEENKNDDEQRKKDQNYYDRNKWKSAVLNLIPEAKNIFIYFMDGYQILALVIGEFDTPLAETASAEINLNENIYLATIRAFDINSDVFPPIARSGGMKSKVARKIADSYIIARQWDEKHLKLAEKAGNLANKVSIKWTEFDQKYKVQEKANDVTKSIFNTVKAFDEKHQLTRRLSNGAKQFNEKYSITEKLNSAVEKVKANEKVQIVAAKVSESVNVAFKAVDDIGQETKQLVQEKNQKQNINDDDNKNTEQEKEKENENEGGNDIPPQQIQQYGNDQEAEVQVQSQ